MNRLRVIVEAVCIVSICALGVGCPGGGSPILSVGPSALSFENDSNEESLTILNSGAGTLSWTAREVMRVGPVLDNNWVPADATYFSLASDDGTDLGNGTIQGDVSGGIHRLRIIADRAGLNPGVFTGFGVEITSSGGNRVVPVTLIVGPTLEVDPTVITIPANNDRALFTIRNSGGQSIAFTIATISDISDPTSIIPLPTYVTELVPGGTVAANGVETISMVVDRTGLTAGLYETILLIESTSGTATVTITFGVGGVSVFDVAPDDITIAANVFGASEEIVEEFVIMNPGTTDIAWNLSVEDIDVPGFPAELPPAVTLSPTSGTVPAGRQQVVEVTVNSGLVGVGEFTNVALVVDGGADGSHRVNLQIVPVLGPRLSIQQEPPFQTFGILDYGTDLDVMTLGVGNTGGVGTLLEFTMRVSPGDEDLIRLPVPAGGNSIGRDCPTIAYLTCFDWQDFPIFIDRSAMDPGAEVDGGQIIIEAEGQEPIVVAVAVTRAPLRIEGATNRSRPPNVARFVLLLRDSLLDVIDTTDPDVLSRLDFSIDEGGLPLELDETNSFVDGPEGLKQNIVLMLDFTGSMYRTGQDLGVPNGQAIQEMVSGSIEFINDLPDTYRVAIMEYHEKNQNLREIHPFSTDKAALTTALANFSLAPADHGATEVYDALLGAIGALVDQDPVALPFDDADVRAVVFVSDGNDTASVSAQSDVATAAAEHRVRLYPVAFGDIVNFAPLASLAEESGGHLFSVIAPRTLTDFLGTAAEEGQIWHDLQRQIVLTYISLTDRDGSYDITASFLDNTGTLISGSFQRNAIFFTGDQRAGQISLTTTGISNDGRADVIVRTDYVPRNVSAMRMRFIIPAAYQANLSSVDLLSSLENSGLMTGWRILDEGNGVYFLVTEPQNPLQFGAFGNVLRLSFDGLTLNDSFEIGFRMDNSLYQRTDPTSTLNTNYFVYPGSHTNPLEVLMVEALSDLAPPAQTVPDLQDTSFDPDAPSAFDRDEDGVPDFDDPAPDDGALPTSVLVPSLVSFSDAVTMQTFMVRNNRLDTFDWSLEFDPTSVPFGLTMSASSGTVAPEESDTVTLTVDRTGTPPGTYTATIEVTSSINPDPEQLTVTVEVAP